MSDLCHICGGSTDYYCQVCDKPVCEECCIPYNQFTQIDYTLCQSCYDVDMAERTLEVYREEDQKEAEKAKKNARNKKARERYWKPENIAKRQKKREERKRKQKEEQTKILTETFKIVNNWMNNGTM